MTVSRSGTTIKLPLEGGALQTYRMRQPREFARPSTAFTVRRCFAAPHVVADALAEYTPGDLPPVDWESTVAFRRHLWSYGIGVAEAMDTSERGPGGLSWSQAKQLIQRSLAAAQEVGGDIVCGAGTEQLTEPAHSLAEIVDAYREQTEFIESHGGSCILRSSHALVPIARGPEDYLDVYGRVLTQLDRPAIVHWLGTVFDPTLRGYWGNTALETVVELAERFTSKIDGIKFSMLDASLEAELRARLPEPIRVYTGDDYDYTELLLGDERGHSHGLLGIFDPIAPIASQALQALEAADSQSYTAELSATTALARRLFEAPAAAYKTGNVFIAYLSGHQSHFRMVSGREGMRSVLHLTDLFRLCDALGLLPDPDLAAHRMGLVLALAGIE